VERKPFLVVRMLRAVAGAWRRFPERLSGLSAGSPKGGSPKGGSRKRARARRTAAPAEAGSYLALSAAASGRKRG
jgi:hypothetical protein